jgi:uncharacterized membrane protein YgcG
MRVVCFALLALLASVSSSAQERILSYDIDISIGRDGALEVTEQIAVRAEGQQIRRGIFRDFPTRYRDRYGNRVVVDFEMLAVERNGKPEPWFIENVSNGVRINTGNDDFLPTPAEHVFTLRYRTNRQLGFFADHDELYWNAIGTGWAFAIDQASVKARLPTPVPMQDLRPEGYTGSQGAKGTDYIANVPAPGQALWRTNRPLQPGEGFTIVLSFPKDVIPAPTGGRRVAWLLKDNRGVLIALIGFGLLIVYCLREWRRVGRDPSKGIVIARYEPAEGHTPASLRYLMRMGYDMRCFSAEILALAVAGFVRIDREQGFLKDEWTLERVHDTSSASLSENQRVLLDRLFSGGKSSLELKKSNAQGISSAKQAHSKALDRAAHPRYFKRNSASIAKAFLVGALSAGLALLLAGGGGIPAIAVIAVLMAIAVIVFGFVVRAPTPEGRKLMDEVEGLKLYLSVAERDELARMQGPDKPPPVDARRYELLLPYAVALDVEDAWTDKFIAAAGAAAAVAATNNMGWYRGGRAGDLSGFSRALGSSLTSQIASSSTPPGSSSGSGGGGSVGGGGGGGGGGGR